MSPRPTIRGRLCGAVLEAGWYGLSSLLAPVLRINLRRRLAHGKETPASLPQRRGLANRPRPPGVLAWLHAASVGETVALLPVVEHLLDADPTLHVLVTTGTVTGSAILHDRLPAMAGQDRVITQFAPLDVPRWGARFLDYWHPDVGALVESELWPNLIAACHARHMPLALLNGRMSDRSLASWRGAACLLARMLSTFAWVMARSAEDAARLQHGGATRIDLIADLKDAAPPLPHDSAELARLQTVLAGRPIWVAASTHPGEDATIIATSALVRQAMPDALTILIPRHPERGTDIAALASPYAPRRALGQTPAAQDGLWICDTLGEMGLFFALGAPVLMGNSLPGGTGGGHNPLEPARAGCPVASGPRIGNFRQAYARMEDSVQFVETPPDIAQWLIPLLQSPEACHKAGARARRHALPDPTLAQNIAHALLALGPR
ncbi:3-deoxy-D-manno-octulosonic acid transferase [Komagataeibacter sucrofermentans]|uniref:3-deoxy-D-manno-octulosonic acid transferase n=1 Tax=Komagataeibacter sucrofermentans TaxID=1053551 RepID=A0A318QRA1_9PROT|nr:glycosyltransferase N-terminal domain-containing protein [Komagataeibacter sucrofermentans]PYD79852.1 3-deoxy-D-manno-octulosonic acid transferase [Komagataeibacter sucrofermentans]GBQ51902.1 3-deoxy-D-manno-octulosonic-acid transferase [Komagataeibacter sucrofermentans DSM 15973]